MSSETLVMQHQRDNFAINRTLVTCVSRRVHLAMLVGILKQATD